MAQPQILQSCLYIQHLVFIIKILSSGYDACFLGQILNPFSFENSGVCGYLILNQCCIHQAFCSYVSPRSFLKRQWLPHHFFLTYFFCIFPVFLLPFLPSLIFYASGICSEAQFYISASNLCFISAFKLVNYIIEDSVAESFPSFFSVFQSSMQVLLVWSCIAQTQTDVCYTERQS